MHSRRRGCAHCATRSRSPACARSLRTTLIRARLPRCAAILRRMEWQTPSSRTWATRRRCSTRRGHPRANALMLSTSTRMVPPLPSSTRPCRRLAKAACSWLRARTWLSSPAHTRRRALPSMAHTRKRANTATSRRFAFYLPASTATPRATAGTLRRCSPCTSTFTSGSSCAFTRASQLSSSRPQRCRTCTSAPAVTPSRCSPSHASLTEAILRKSRRAPARPCRKTASIAAKCTTLVGPSGARRSTTLSSSPRCSAGCKSRVPSMPTARTSA
mmetsp:Transcript_6418/g.18085  ORF Transcript_6418/g.18085 Transcript_6418/m.18085 type:complete len:273 (-) Transcript_6418:1112-1930(-)